MDNVQLKSSRAALVLIDLQQGIVARKGEPYSTGEVVVRCAALSKMFRAAKALVVYVNVDLINFRQLIVDVPGRDPNAPLNWFLMRDGSPVIWLSPNATGVPFSVQTWNGNCVNIRSTPS